MTPQPKPVKVSQDEARLEFVRAMPCLIAEYAISIAHAVACSSSYVTGLGWAPAHVEAHHVRKGTHTAMGRKPPASRTVPLCSAGHSEYHRIGHAAFEAKYGLNLEEHIERINREFRATQPTRKPKVTRKPSLKVGLGIKNCRACRGEHFYRLPPPYSGGYTCKITGIWVPVESMAA